MFNKYWSQSEIEICIELSDNRVSLQFYDEHGKRKTSSERSRGLTRFVSFLAQVITQSESQLENAVILLDSPGAHLHPEAHKNLRESLESLATANQLLLATHAPYMINTDELTKIRVVRRPGDGTGTVIKTLAPGETASSDSLAPVRASLGATFSDSLFSSSQTVLVEGFEDRLYINSFSKAFDKYEGETSISLSPNVQIIDCGGATKTTYMGRLVDSENYKYAVFLDGDEEGRIARRQLSEAGLSREGVLSVSDIVDNSYDSTIEDLFSREYYTKVTAEVHDIELNDFKDEALNAEKSIVSCLNGELKRIKRSTDKGLLSNKSEIAQVISNNLMNGEYDIDDFGNDTVRNFENLISNLNPILDDNEGNDSDSSLLERIPDNGDENI